MLTRNIYSTDTNGFTILEMAVVITIISFIVAMTVATGIVRIDAQRLRTTNLHMKFLTTAIQSYVDVYKHLPCPADGALSSTSSDYGWGEGSGSLGGCAASNLLTSGTIVAGAVPAINLGIDPRSTIDAWGNKITYVVDQALASKGGFEFDSKGQITILNERGGASPATIETEAAYVLISHGPNGHGAWRAKGGLGAGTDRVDTGIADATDEGENSHIDTPASYDAEFVQKFFLPNFDDIVIYKTKWQLD